MPGGSAQRIVFYRRWEVKLDPGSTGEWAHELKTDCGRPAIDPVVFFELRLGVFFDGIRSERELIDTASLNLTHCRGDPSPR